MLALVTSRPEASNQCIQSGEKKFSAQDPNTLIPVGDFLIGSCGMAYGCRKAILLVSTELPDASTGSTGSTRQSKYTRTRREDRQGDFGGCEAISLPLGTVMITITIFASHEVRFPASNSEVYRYHWTTLTAGPKTSRDRVGSDGMNKDPDYLAAYCILQTNSEHTGHGMVNFLPSRLLKTGFN